MDSRESPTNRLCVKYLLLFVTTIVTAGEPRSENI